MPKCDEYGLMSLITLEDGKSRRAAKYFNASQTGFTITFSACFAYNVTLDIASSIAKWRRSLPDAAVT